MAKNSGGMRTGTMGNKGFPSTAPSSGHTSRPTLRNYREGVIAKPSTGGAPSAAPKSTGGKKTSC